MPTPITRRVTSKVAASLQYLQPRDRLLLRLLSDHLVLTTGQITTLLFGSTRLAQRRLLRLYQLGWLDRFRHAQEAGGSQPWRWTLGPLGMTLQAVTEGGPTPSERSIRDRLTRLAGSPTLAHRLGVNQFFVDLIAHSHMHHGSRLLRWLPEQRAAALLRQAVIPDGHGIWHTSGHTSAWFLEHDTGSEDLPRLVAKIAGYDKAARTGAPAYPVLLWLHSRTREHNLHRLLSGLTARCPVATATRAAAGGPAGRVWWPLGGGRRLHLPQLGGHVKAPGGDWRDEHQLPEHQP
jgi:hypothetical protein